MMGLIMLTGIGFAEVNFSGIEDPEVRKVVCGSIGPGIATQLGKTVTIVIPGFFKSNQVAYCPLNKNKTDNYKIEFEVNRILASTLVHLTPLEKDAAMELCVLVNRSVYTFYIVESDAYTYYPRIEADFKEFDIEVPEND